MSDKICFVISPIGKEGSATRDRSDQILEFIIQPAAEECGYKAERADSSPRPGLITKQIIDQLIDAPLVIADLTEGNANVFYELAVRHAVKKPFVHIIDRDAEIPFDVGPMRVVYVTHQDLAQADKAREELVQHIKAAETEAEALENPISTTVELRGLQKTGRSGDRLIAEILETVQRIERQRRDERVSETALQTILEALDPDNRRLSQIWRPGERAFAQLRPRRMGLLEGSVPRQGLEEAETPPTDVSGGPKSS